jgi:hypothetical protein
VANTAHAASGDAQADRVLPFDASITLGALEDAFVDVGLALQNVVAGDDAHQAQRIYVTADRGTLVYLVDDARLGARFLLMRGGRASEIEAAIVARFRVVEAP